MILLSVCTKDFKIPSFYRVLFQIVHVRDAYILIK